jgi:hypothetical protein
MNASNPIAKTTVTIAIKTPDSKALGLDLGYSKARPDSLRQWPIRATKFQTARKWSGNVEERCWDE